MAMHTAKKQNLIIVRMVDRQIGEIQCFNKATHTLEWSTQIVKPLLNRLRAFSSFTVAKKQVDTTIY